MSYMSYIPEKIYNKNIARFIGVLIGLVAWILIALNYPQDLVPLPHEAVLLTWQIIESGRIWEHLVPTVWRTVWGFLGAMVLGITVGIIMGVSFRGQNITLPYIIIGLSIPGVAWAAIWTIIFGFTHLTPIVTVLVVCFPYIAMNFWKGVENIQLDLVKMAKTFDVTNKNILQHIIIPNTAPAAFTSARFGLSISWKVVAVAEMFSANYGIGVMIIRSFELFRYTETWAWALIFVVIILFIENGIFKPLENKLFKYREETDISRI